MLIHSMEFENYTTGQQIKKMDFDKLNLLVGRSGAGKTQILKTLSAYVTAAYREPVISSIQFNGRFKLDFSMLFPDINSRNIFRRKNVSWEIYTDEMKKIVNEPYRLPYGVSEEYLFINEEKLIERSKSTLKIGNEKTAAISPEQSVVNVFMNPTEVSYVRTGLSSIISYYHQRNALNDVSRIEGERIRNEFYRLSKINDPSSKVAIQIFLMFYPSLMQIDMVKQYVLI